MSTDLPDSFDDVPTLRPLPSDDGQAALERDYGELPARPRRKPGFGFWMAVLWALLYFVVTQIIAGVGFGLLIFGIALIPEIRQNGMAVLSDPAKLNEWMLGPTGRVATLTLVAATQFTGLLLSWLLLRYWCGREWKRKIALTRRPSITHAALVLIGFPALIAMGAAIEVPINQYLPSMQDILNSLGIKGDFQGSEMLPKLIGPSPWALVLFAVAVSPAICEEVFCRGFLAWGVSGRYRTWLVVLIVSFLFGCLHGDPRQGTGAMFLGAAIHGAYIATRSLWVAMFVHLANNGVAVLHFNDQLVPGLLDPFEHTLKDNPALFVCTGLLFFAAVAYALYQTRCRLAAADPGLPTWEPEGVSRVELPPRTSGTVVAHDPISPVSVALVVAGAVAFGLVMAFA